MVCLNLLDKNPIGVVQLPASKSISNRLLILNTVIGGHLELENISLAEDTLVLVNALQFISSNHSGIIDVGHAGTDFRFLTALLALKKGNWVLTGSERLKQRPIKHLVSVLQTLGADISYLEKEGFAPLAINGKNITGGNVSINASTSSQFISALLMVAPLMKEGLQITLTGTIVSESYIKMTTQLMQTIGLSLEKSERRYFAKPITNFAFEKKLFKIESDWSAASYWYAFVALSKSGIITLPTLYETSLQGDSILANLFLAFGVETTFRTDAIELKKVNITLPSVFNYDCSNCPDIAQTLVVVCCALGIETKLTGLSTLVSKETHRLQALQTEFKKLAVDLEVSESHLYLPKTNPIHFPKQITIDTYNDHRMAMCFAPLTMCIETVCFKDSEVVKKSYPRFWEEVSTCFN
jgi:3-phosphoshikimate 1-carboxyvinyltransferase